VLEDYIQAVEAACARRDRLTAQIEAMLPDWALAPIVAALQTIRGMALVNAATLIANWATSRGLPIRHLVARISWAERLGPGSVEDHSPFGERDFAVAGLRCSPPRPLRAAKSG
jgi:hypothetical protein